MKGNILDFLKLVAENPDLARRIGELASEYGFAFSDDELTEGDLEAVTGGVLDSMTDLTQLSQLELQQAMSKQSETVQMMSNIMKQQHDTLSAIIQNMR